MNIKVDNEAKIHLIKFDNLGEFYNYIKTTPTNRVFADKDKDIIARYGKDSEQYKRYTATQSSTISHHKESWTGTKTLEEAEELFIKGIPDQSEKLTKMLKAEKKLTPVQGMKRVNSIQGFQPVVPLYLMGVPNNMISQQMQPVKQKVVNLYSNISYLCNVSTNEINTECIKKFRLINKLESQNYRVNLNLIFGSRSTRIGARVTRDSDYVMNFVMCIRLKSANERLNISKLVFPLTHPSMERRLIFRLMEVYPDMVSGYTDGYGTHVSPDIFRNIFDDGYILPEFITKDIEQIKSLDELKFL